MHNASNFKGEESAQMYRSLLWLFATSIHFLGVFSADVLVISNQTQHHRSISDGKNQQRQRRYVVWFRIKVHLFSLHGKSYSCSIYILDRVATKWMSHVVIAYLHPLKNREIVEMVVQGKLDGSQAKLHRFVQGEWWLE